MVQKGTEPRLHTAPETSYHNGERGKNLLAEPTKAVFLTNLKIILSGIGPRMRY